jgi:hypothetical protein
VHPFAYRPLPKTNNYGRAELAHSRPTDSGTYELLIQGVFWQRRNMPRRFAQDPEAESALQVSPQVLWPAIISQIGGRCRGKL